MGKRETRFCPWCGEALASREIEGRDRAACSSDGCGYVFWDNPVPVVAAIVELEGPPGRGKVVLVRNRGWPEKMYGLVSGFLERDETAEAAARREVAEELALDPLEVSLIGLYPFFARNELILAYHVLARGDVSIGEELAGYKEIPIEKLKPWSFGTGPAVADWLARRSS